MKKSMILTMMISLKINLLIIRIKRNDERTNGSTNEQSAIRNHKDNIDRIKKEYFDSNYGLKEGDKIRILHEAGDEMIGFLKKVEVCGDGDLYLTIQKQNEKGGKGRGVVYIYVTKSIKIEKIKDNI